MSILRQSLNTGDCTVGIFIQKEEDSVSICTVALDGVTIFFLVSPIFRCHSRKRQMKSMINCMRTCRETLNHTTLLSFKAQKEDLITIIAEHGTSMLLSKVKKPFDLGAGYPEKTPLSCPVFCTAYQIQLNGLDAFC